MGKAKRESKGYNEKNPVHPQGSFPPENADEAPGYPVKSTKNEKMSIPERKLKGDKRKPDA